MYSRFLEEAGYESQSVIAAEAAADWTSLAIAARDASGPMIPTRSCGRRSALEAARVLEAEERLWTGLSGDAAPG